MSQPHGPGERQRPLILARPAAHTRCPYCHDEVFRGGVRCGCCGAKHHSMCVDEHATCATCGYDLQDEVHRVLLAESEACDSKVMRAIDGVIPTRKRWHDFWQTWRKGLTHPLYVSAIAIAGGLVILGFILERVLT